MEKKCVKARITIAVATLIVTIIGTIIATTCTIAVEVRRAKEKYDCDAKAASRYTYSYESYARVDVGTYTMTAGKICFAIERAYDANPHTTAESVYDLSYKKSTSAAYTIIAAGVRLSQLKNAAGTYGSLANTTKSTKWDIKIDKTAGLDRKTAIDMLVFVQ